MNNMLAMICHLFLELNKIVKINLCTISLSEFWFDIPGEVIGKFRLNSDLERFIPVFLVY